MKQLRITQSITNRGAQSFDRYLKEIGQEELITAEEEVELAQKIKNGDQKAFDKLVRANLRFVISVAKHYQNQGLLLPDLINEGNLGLIKAVQRFDETRGFKFISYAVYWIRQNIIKALTDQGRIVRLPLNKIGVKNKVNKTLSHLEQKLERDPTDEEIARELEILPHDVRQAIKNNLKDSSLDWQPNLNEGENDSSNLYNLMEDRKAIKPDQFLTTEDLKIEIERSLNTLTMREQNILRLFFGLNERRYGLALEEIGVKFNLTRERVRQIKEKAIRKLKAGHRSRLLRAYL